MISALQRARRAAGKIWPASSTRIAILAYHRVFPAVRDPQKLCVSPKHFAEHLDVLKRHGNVLALDKAVALLRHGRMPRRAVVITFDDGYQDNLAYAKPLLVGAGMPATVFVATGYLGRSREFWWDELERLILTPTVLPDTISLRVANELHEWQLSGPACDPSWAVDSTTSPTPRQRAYLELHRLLRPASESERDAALESLRAQVTDDGRARDGYRPLADAEAATLADGDLVTLGAHTVTHPLLAAQSLDAQRWEFSESRARLESITGRPVTSVSYPYGGGSDVVPMTTTIAREAGFDAACANVPGLAIAHRVDPCWLPRFLVRDWDGDRFQRELATFFGD